jgi:hypothetical protein
VKLGVIKLVIPEIVLRESISQLEGDYEKKLSSSKALRSLSNFVFLSADQRQRLSGMATEIGCLVSNNEIAARAKGMLVAAGAEFLPISEKQVTIA